MIRIWLTVCLIGMCLFSPRSTTVSAPQIQDHNNPQIPVDTALTLNAASTIHKSQIKSVLLVECPKTKMKGTGFLTTSGLVVTAAHVLCGCGSSEVTATTVMNRPVHFSTVVSDEDRDLAAMVPTQPLTGGLELAADAEVPAGGQVNTWGYPLIYNGPAPLLSVGYVSGYQQSEAMEACSGLRREGVRFKHVVVNGAFNPGNSGGPLVRYGQTKVVGVIIWKSIAFSDMTRRLIDGFGATSAVMSGAQIRMPDGTIRGFSQQQMIQLVLDEFYRRVQVDIGEAVSVSELRSFLREHSAQLSAR